MIFKVLSITFGIWLIACTGSDSAGGGSETRNVGGKIISSNGEPAANAKVSLYKRITDTKELNQKPIIVDSAYTDENGSYKIEVFETGIYSIVSENENEMGFLDSIHFDFGQTISVDDTLSSPGSISCSINKILEVRDMRGLLVHLIGTSFYQNLTKDGVFSFSEVPAGKYTIVLWSETENEIAPSFSSIIVKSNQKNTCSEQDIDLIYTGIPIPNIKSISYDILNGKVSLSWKILEYEHLQHFLIERNIYSPENSSEWKTIGSTKELKFEDTIFENHGSQSSNDTVPKTLHYRVRIKNAYEEVGQNYGYQSIEVVSPRILYPYIDLDSIYSVGIGDTLKLQLKGFSIYGIEEYFLKKPNGNFEEVSGDSLFLVPTKDKESYQVKLVDKKKNESTHLFILKEEPTITQVSIDDWKSYSSFELKQTYVLARKAVGGECQEAIFNEENGEWVYSLNYQIDLPNMSERSCRRDISEVFVFENIAYRVYEDPSNNWYLQKSTNLKNWESFPIPYNAVKEYFHSFGTLYKTNNSICVVTSAFGIFDTGVPMRYFTQDFCYTHEHEWVSSVRDSVYGGSFMERVFDTKYYATDLLTIEKEHSQRSKYWIIKNGISFYIQNQELFILFVENDIYKIAHKTISSQEEFENSLAFENKNDFRIYNTYLKYYSVDRETQIQPERYLKLIGDELFFFRYGTLEFFKIKIK